MRGALLKLVTNRAASRSLKVYATKRCGDCMMTKAVLDRAGATDRLLGGLTWREMVAYYVAH